MAAVILDNDRAGKKHWAFLDTKLKMFQTFCDTVRPQGTVQLLEEPAGGWRAIPEATPRAPTAPRAPALF